MVVNEMVNNKKYRQNNLSSYLLIFMVLIVFMFLLGIKVVPGIATESIELQEQIIHQVSPGENLWKIALKYKEESQDTRDKVDEIRETNQLEDANVHVGDQLIIYKNFE